jgi:hypothetical protein
MSPARYCRCSKPAPQIDSDGVHYCSRCGELVPEPADVVLPILIRHVADLERQIASLTERMKEPV